MVSIALSKMDMTELIFVDPGMKVNGQYYRNVLLSQQMLLAIKHVAVAGDRYVCLSTSQRSISSCQEHHSKKRRTSLVLVSGHQTWIQWIIRPGCYAPESVWMSCEQCRWAEAGYRWNLEQSAAERYRRGHQWVQKATESVRSCRGTTFWT